MQDNTFYQLESDEFDTDDIVTVYPRNPFDDDGADNIFGLGNKQKKAEKKIRKAEKQLEKGHIAKAEKKLAKAAKKLGASDVLKQSILTQAQTIAQGRATNPAINESMSTAAGQIGTAAGTPTIQPSQIAGGGSGGSDSGSMDMGYTPDTTMADITPETTTPTDTPTGDLATVKDLQGVTVTSTTQNKLLIFIVLGAVVLLAVWYFSKHKSLK